MTHSRPDRRSWLSWAEIQTGSVQMHFLVGLISLLWVRTRGASSHRDSLSLDLLLWSQQSCLSPLFSHLCSLHPEDSCFPLEQGQRQTWGWLIRLTRCLLGHEAAGHNRGNFPSVINWEVPLGLRSWCDNQK